MSTPSSAVTVGIPFYAGETPSHFRDAIDSVLRQSHSPDVVHLVQDGPVPEVLSDIVDRYTTSYDEVVHIHISSNRGLSYALNTSIRQTETPYYARMDADDICHQERLKRQIDFLEAHPTVDILGTAALEFEAHPDESGKMLKKMPEQKEEIERMGRQDRARMLQREFARNANFLAKCGGEISDLINSFPKNETFPVTQEFKESLKNLSWAVGVMKKHNLI